MDYIQELQTKKGTCYRVKFPYKSGGSRKFYSKSFNSADYPNKTEALNAAKRHLAHMKSKLEQRSAYRGATLEQVIELKQKNYPRTQSTVKKEMSILRTHVFPHIPKERQFSSIKIPEIQETLNRMIQTERDDTITRLRHIWNILYMTAEIEGIVESNPMSKVRTPKSEVIETHRSQDTDKETLDRVVRLLLRSKGNERTDFNDRMIAYSLLAMYYLGLRPGEAFAISKDCVDLDNNRILINKAIGSTVTEDGTVKKTKTSRSVRLLPIPVAFKPILEKMMYRPHLFYNVDERPLNSSVVSARVNTIAKSLGVDFHAYQLRHRFITDLWESQADKNTIQNTVGHANESMSLSYGVSDLEKVEEAVQKIR